MEHNFESETSWAESFRELFPVNTLTCHNFHSLIGLTYIKVIGTEEKVCIKEEFRLLKSMTIRNFGTLLDFRPPTHICNQWVSRYSFHFWFMAEKTFPQKSLMAENMSLHWKQQHIQKLSIIISLESMDHIDWIFWVAWDTLPPIRDHCQNLGHGIFQWLIF